MSEDESYNEFRWLCKRLTEFKLPCGIHANKDGLKTVLQLLASEVPQDKCKPFMKYIIKLLKDFTALNLRSGYHYAIANNDHNLAGNCLMTIVKSSILFSSESFDLVSNSFPNISRNTSEYGKRVNSVCSTSDNNPHERFEELPEEGRNNGPVHQIITTTAVIESSSDQNNRQQYSVKPKYVSSHRRTPSSSSTDSEGEDYLKKRTGNKRPPMGKTYASSKTKGSKENSCIRQREQCVDEPSCSYDLTEAGYQPYSSRNKHNGSTREKTKQHIDCGRSRKRSLDNLGSESPEPLSKAGKHRLHKKQKRFCSDSECEIKKKNVDARSCSDKYDKKCKRMPCHESYNSDDNRRSRRHKSNKCNCRQYVLKYKKQHSPCSYSESQSESEEDRRYKRGNKRKKQCYSDTCESEDSVVKKRRVPSGKKNPKRRYYIHSDSEISSSSSEVNSKQNKSGGVKYTARRSRSLSPKKSKTSYKSRNNLERSFSEPEVSEKNKYKAPKSKSRRTETDSDYDNKNPRSKSNTKNYSDDHKVLKKDQSDRLKNKQPLDWSKSESQNTSLFMTRLKQLDSELLQNMPDPLENGKNTNSNSKVQSKKSNATIKDNKKQNKKSPANAQKTNDKDPVSNKSKSDNSKSPASCTQSKAAKKKSPAATTQYKASNKKSPAATAPNKASNKKSPAATATNKASNKKSPAASTQKKVANKKSPAAGAKSKPANSKSSTACSPSKVVNKSPAVNAQSKAVKKKSPAPSSQKGAGKKKCAASSQKKKDVLRTSLTPEPKTKKPLSNKKVPSEKTQSAKTTSVKVSTKKTKANSDKVLTTNKQTTEPNKLNDEKNTHNSEEVNKVNCDNDNKISNMNQIENKDSDKIDQNDVENRANKSGDSFSSDDDFIFESEPELGTLSARLNSIRRILPRQVGSATPPMNIFLSPHSDTVSQCSLSSSYSDVPMKIDDKNVVKRMAKANKPKEVKRPKETAPQKLEATPEALRKIMKIKKATESNDDSDIECSSFSE